MEIQEQDSYNPNKIRSKIEEETDEPPDQPPEVVFHPQISYMDKKSGNSDTQQQQEFQMNFDVDNGLGDGNIIDMADSQQLEFKEIDIILYDQYKDNKTVFQKRKCYINQNKEILLSLLVDDIKNDYKNEFQGALISYFDSIRDLYIFCGQYPLHKNCFVPYETIVGDSLEIKVRSKKKDLASLLIEEQKERVQKNQSEDDYKNINNNQQKQRVKERKIKEVVEKVALWRRFYTGYIDENQKNKSMPLETAADKVGISKKTLDDYLLQIRCGKKYGFNFNDNLDERIGKLRSFVKEAKKRKN